jgi:hypothetical protein
MQSLDDGTVVQLKEWVASTARRALEVVRNENGCAPPMASEAEQQTFACYYATNQVWAGLLTGYASSD